MWQFLPDSKASLNIALYSGPWKGLLETSPICIL